MYEEKIEQRLANPLNWQEQYLWAVLHELREIRKALAPEEAASETVKLRESKGKG